MSGFSLRGNEADSLPDGQPEIPQPAPSMVRLADAALERGSTATTYRKATGRMLMRVISCVAENGRRIESEKPVKSATYHRLDLHDLNDTPESKNQEAFHAMIRKRVTGAIDTAIKTGKKNLLLITGKGIHSVRGVSSMREYIETTYLPALRTSSQIVGFTAVIDTDGGYGSFMLELPKSQNPNGKV